MTLETWQWIKALSAVGQSDWHRQNRDRALRLISCAPAPPSTAVTPATSRQSYSKRPENHNQSIGKGTFDKIIHQLGYSHACTRWVPRSLTEEHKEQRKIIRSELLAHYGAESDEAYP
jgi:hypothetical protein